MCGGATWPKIDSRKMKAETAVTYQLDVYSFKKEDALWWWDGQHVPSFSRSHCFLCLVNMNECKDECSVESHSGQGLEWELHPEISTYWPRQVKKKKSIKQRAPTIKRRNHLENGRKRVRE